MSNHRSTGAESDAGKLHTFVMDYCFPSQGSQQGITVLDVNGTKNQGDQHIHSPEQRCH